MGTWVTALWVVLQGAAAGTAPVQVPASVELRNEMGRGFRLVEAHVTLDGQAVSDRVATRGQELERSFRAYGGAVAPGEHVLRVDLVFEGRNRGPFTYLDDIRYRVDGQSLFVARAGGEASVDVVAQERKGANVPFEQKPQIRFAPAPGSELKPPPAPPPR